MAETQASKIDALIERTTHETYKAHLAAISAVAKIGRGYGLPADAAIEIVDAVLKAVRYEEISWRAAREEWTKAYERPVQSTWPLDDAA